MIFPIEYIDISDYRANRRQSVIDASVLDLLVARQLLPFAEHRHEDPNSPHVRRIVAKLAKDIDLRLVGQKTIAAASGPTPTPTASPRLRTTIVAPSPPPETKPSWASAVGRDEFGEWADISVNGMVQRLRLIPAGDFLMGSPEGEGFPPEQPQVPIRIAEPFWMFDTPVTQALWQAVLGTSPSHFKGLGRPVENISWYDAERFTFALNLAVPGLNISLPSESMWEYACRAGTTGQRYNRNIDRIAWVGEGSAGQTHEVKGKLPNAWGMYDMLGNVWEWCADVWTNSLRDTPTDGSRRGPSRNREDRVVRGSSARVVRGGNWLIGAEFARAASRDSYGPSERSAITGFRLARFPPVTAQRR